MARQQPRIDIIAAADAVADVQVDVLALVEIRALREDRYASKKQQRQAAGDESRLH
jgi:hypothetical protein